MPAPPILAIALPTPLRKLFDYLPPATANTDQLQPGVRVRVSFGRQTLIGVIVALHNDSQLPVDQLKTIDAFIDEQPCLPDTLLQLCQWASRYYHHAYGEVLSTALPGLLRLGEPARLQPQKIWQLTDAGQTLAPAQLARAPRQQEALMFLQQPGNSHPPLEDSGISRATLKAMQDKGLITEVEETPAAVTTTGSDAIASPGLTLNSEQQAALDQVELKTFAVHLLQGETGSGKTEVYLQVIARVLEQGGQALVLVPEIGLTPQTIARFRQRFNVPFSILHSGLNDRQRLDAWLHASLGISRIIIGTRSAVWTPAPQLGIVIIDEEHDLSFKQQDGLRYSARDLAAVRCQQASIPLLLGTATPSLETLHNGLTGRFRHARLQQRAGDATPPELIVQDIRQQTLMDGFTEDSLTAIRQTLQAGNQVLVFINRRGFAPTLMCHDCGWQACCPHCDARLTVHHHPQHLHCHHCDHQRSLIHQCQRCLSRNLLPVGQGTERTELNLRQWFPDTNIIRVDRDSTRRKDAFTSIFEQVHTGEPCILVGTQMLAKGHHFPDVTLVVILDADSGLFSADFRGAERMGQLLLQVAGRAGRADKPGHVIIQTHLPDHPLLQTLTQQGYTRFAQLILQERQVTALPPFSFMGLLRAESKHAQLAYQFLQEARVICQSITADQPASNLLGPLPAPMEKRNQRFRYQLQISSPSRNSLHNLLSNLMPQLDALPTGKRVRWSLDVDPLDLS